VLPIERPGKIVCVGLNYRDHAEEQGVELPQAPLLFAKWPSSLIGPGDAIEIPPIVGDGQWTRGKSPDTFCPVGPMTPRDDIPDPHALKIRAIVSGEVLQDSTTANLIFGVDDVIAYASQTTTLEPGDLILTGTPAGVGVFRDPQRLLQPGDEVTIEIEGLESLTNPVVAG
jgi:2,4-didehydro-3-deoxy-L-rhamnonate hydrolase